MLVDTHCHLNMIVKEKFDTPLSKAEFPLAKNIINAAIEKKVNKSFKHPNKQEISKKPILTRSKQKLKRKTH